jgi:hypothetical protein
MPVSLSRVEMKLRRQLEVISREAALPARPEDQHDQNDRRNRPIADRPIQNRSGFREYPASEIPDLVHQTYLREKAFACEQGVITMITSRIGGRQVFPSKAARKK